MCSTHIVYSPQVIKPIGPHWKVILLGLLYQQVNVYSQIHSMLLLSERSNLYETEHPCTTDRNKKRPHHEINKRSKLGVSFGIQILEMLWLIIAYDS